MDREIDAVIMRGGTSRAVFFRKESIPTDDDARDRLLLRVLGSPDPYSRQIDGLGGATSSTSKAAIIAPSGASGIDVDYTFAQVGIDQAFVNFDANCGNISAAVGPYAIDAGMVSAVEPSTPVRIFNTNTAKIIEAAVPVRGGRFESEGNYAIDGVPGTASRIDLEFLSPGGAITGRLLPTGNARDVLDVPGVGHVEVSIVDAAHLFVFVRLERLSIQEETTPEALNQLRDLLVRLEAVRATAACAIGIASSVEEATRLHPTVPRLALVAPPAAYVDTRGRNRSPADHDVLVRAVSIGKVHHAYPVTGGLCTAVAARIPGTIVAEATADGALSSRFLRCGHPGGSMDVSADIRFDGDDVTAHSAGVARTARRLMHGTALVPTSR